MRKALLLFCVAFCACSDSRPLLERSCAGEAVGPCAPFAYSVMTDATFAPTELQVGDLSANAQVHVQFENCGDASPVGHSVHIQALVTRASSFGDGGVSTQVFDVNSIYDDGSAGDAVAKDGIIDVSIPNPFTSQYPPNASITLRFTPRASLACEGQSLEVPYQIGDRFMPTP